MSLGRRVVRRLGFSVVVVYLVVSVTFAFVALTPNAHLLGEVQQAVFYERISAEERVALQETYLRVRGQDRPVLVRYGDWLYQMATLEWGYSFSQRRMVTEVLARRIPYTAAYVLPAMALSVVAGVALGAYSAAGRDGPGDRIARVLVYAVQGLPNFWLGEMAILLLAAWAGWQFDPAAFESLWSVDAAVALLPAVAVLTTGLVAGQARYARAEYLEHAGREFVTLLRAKGASGFQVARHVLRNAAIPLTSLFFTEMLGVLVLNVFVVEFVFGIPGIGLAAYEAIEGRDVPLLLGTTMVVVLFGVAGSLVQDLAADVLDPRVGEDG